MYVSTVLRILRVLDIYWSLVFIATVPGTGYCITSAAARVATYTVRV